MCSLLVGRPSQNPLTQGDDGAYSRKERVAMAQPPTCASAPHRDAPTLQTRSVPMPAEALIRRRPLRCERVTHLRQVIDGLQKYPAIALGVRICWRIWLRLVIRDCFRGRRVGRLCRLPGSFFRRLFGGLLLTLLA